MNTLTCICIPIRIHSWGRPHECEYVNLCVYIYVCTYVSYCSCLCARSLNTYWHHSPMHAKPTLIPTTTTMETW